MTVLLGNSSHCPVLNMVVEYIYVEISTINNMLGCAYLDEFKACVNYHNAFPCHGIPNRKNISSMT